MRFLIDAQLPKSTVQLLGRLGHESQHVCDLPRGTRTPDDDIARFADRDGAVLISKDRDFLTFQVLSGIPDRVLLISTGNMPNPALFSVLERHWTAITSALASSHVVEVGANQITVLR